MQKPETVRVRQEHSVDAPAVRRVNEAAFGQTEEADIVEALHAAGAVTLSLVAEEEDGIIGHILFSPVTIQTAAGSFTAVGLGPMAVLPQRQRQGIGSMLVQESLEMLRQAGHRAVLVLGHPEYYPRFDFVPASRFGLRWEMECPDEAFMAMELQPGALNGRRGVVSYRPEFSSAEQD